MNGWSFRQVSRVGSQGVLMNLEVSAERVGLKWSSSKNSWPSWPDDQKGRDSFSRSLISPWTLWVS